MATLVDIQPFKYLLKESREKPGVIIVEGLMQVAGDLNGNGRIYPKPLLEREVEKYKETFIKAGNSYGELDHPESPIVSLKNVSHIIKDLWWEGNNLMGRVEILNTPFGNIVKEILKAGYSIGISSRGEGSVTELNDGTGRVQVNDDFDLITWDFVSNPSVSGAFMRPTTTLNEGKEHVARYAKLNTILNDILRS
jgi:hypothetical protein